MSDDCPQTDHLWHDAISSAAHHPRQLENYLSIFLVRTPISTFTAFFYSAVPKLTPQQVNSLLQDFLKLVSSPSNEVTSDDKLNFLLRCAPHASFCSHSKMFGSFANLLPSAHLQQCCDPFSQHWLYSSPAIMLHCSSIKTGLL